jgi:hypothetical protein
MSIPMDSVGAAEVRGCQRAGVVARVGAARPDLSLQPLFPSTVLFRTPLSVPILASRLPLSLTLCFAVCVCRAGAQESARKWTGASRRV